MQHKFDVNTGQPLQPAPRFDVNTGQPLQAAVPTTQAVPMTQPVPMAQPQPQPTSMPTTQPKKRDFIDKLSGAINPRFSMDYDIGRTLGIMVCAFMCAALIPIVIGAFACTTSSTSTRDYYHREGTWGDHRFHLANYVDQMNNPDIDLSFCLIAGYEYDIRSYNEWTGQSRMMLTSENLCLVMPPDEISRVGFPPQEDGSSLFRWCDLEELPPFMQDFFPQPHPATGQSWNGNIYDNYQVPAYDVVYPGWRSMFDGSGGTRPNVNYRICGVPVSRTTPLEAFTWTNFYSTPTGTQNKFTLIAQVDKTVHTTSCPSRAGAVGSSLGWIGVVELCCTVVVVLGLRLCGVAHPLRKDVSFFNLLKGAGIADALPEEGFPAFADGIDFKMNLQMAKMEEIIKEIPGGAQALTKQAAAAANQARTLHA